MYCILNSAEKGAGILKFPIWVKKSISETKTWNGFVILHHEIIGAEQWPETSCKFCIPYEYWGISFIHFSQLILLMNMMMVEPKYEWK